MLYLSELSFFFLIAGKGKTAFLFSFLIFLFLLFLLWKSQKKINADIAFPFLTALTALAAGVLFYMRWSGTGRMAAAAGRLNLPPKQLAGILASLLSALSVRGIDAFIGAFFALMKIDPKPLNHSTIGIIFILAAAVITISSKCSPLYPFNDWSDPNTMFTIGKSVLSGKVPYRDLFEQKGPILIFAHTLGAAISYLDLHGMWVIEILCAFGFLYWNERILRKQFREDALLALPFLAFFAYTPISFQKGDSAEEFVLPFLAYTFFVLVSALREDRLPSRKEWLFSGAAFAILFWVKFTLVAPFAGWSILAVCSLRKKQFKAFLKDIGVFFCGSLIVTLPILAFFGIHNALRDLFECYFYDNIFLYPQLSSIWENLRMGFGNIWANSAFLVIAAVAGLLWCRFYERITVFWALLCSIVFTFLALLIQ